MSRILTLLALLLAGPALAEGKLPLPEEPHINEQLIAASAGDQLRHICPKVTPRWLVIWDLTLKLKQYAIDQGYTEDEVKAFLADPVQKDRVKAAGMDYLHAAGAVDGDVDSFCAAGRAEVAKGSVLGQIIWVAE